MVWFFDGLGGANGEVEVDVVTGDSFWVALRWAVDNSLILSSNISISDTIQTNMKCRPFACILSLFHQTIIGVGITVCCENLVVGEDKE